MTKFDAGQVASRGDSANSHLHMEDLIAHMRGRVQQLRRVMALAHDPRMIEMIQNIIDEGEADIAKLEAGRLPPMDQPKPE